MFFANYASDLHLDEYRAEGEDTRQQGHREWLRVPFSLWNWSAKRVDSAREIAVFGDTSAHKRSCERGQGIMGAVTWERGLREQSEREGGYRAAGEERRPAAK